MSQSINNVCKILACIKKRRTWSTETLEVIATPQSLPGRVVWRCQTRRLRCNRCRSGRWWISGPWPPAPSWWDAPRAGPAGNSSKEQWSWGKAGNGNGWGAAPPCTHLHHPCEIHVVRTQQRKIRNSPTDLLTSHKHGFLGTAGNQQPNELQTIFSARAKFWN